VCVCIHALVILQANRIFPAPYYVVICGLLDLSYFSTLSHKRYSFRERVAEYKMYVLIWSTNFVWNISHSEKCQRDVIVSVQYTGLRVKYPLFLSHFNETRIFSTDFRKIFKCPVSRKSLQRETRFSMRIDGGTDRHSEANKRFSQFCERAKKWAYRFYLQCIHKIKKIV
jgi:hypothetical protein